MKKLFKKNKTEETENSNSETPRKKRWGTGLIIVLGLLLIMVTAISFLGGSGNSHDENAVAESHDTPTHSTDEHSQKTLVASKDPDTHEAPSHDTHAEPAHDTHAAPAHDTHAEPSHDTHATAAHDTHDAPAHETHSPPAHDTHSEPVHGTHSAPTHDTHAAPGQDTHAAPAHDTHAAPAHDTHATPDHDTHGAPAHDTHAAPAHDTHAAPAHDTHAAPAHDTHAAPAHDTHGAPAHDEHGAAGDAHGDGHGDDAHGGGHMRTWDYPVTGMAFAAATIEPLRYELDERFWGWRPNDLLIFTDNVENFQSGVLEVIRRTAVALAERISRTGSTDAFEPELESAMNWLMIKKDRFWFPSAESKYRLALVELEKYMDKLSTGQSRFFNRADNLIPLLMAYEDLLGSCDENLAKHLEDDGTAVSYFKADDYFYYAKGVATALNTILMAVYQDFHDVIDSRKGLETLHHAIESCHHAMEVRPLLVLESSLSSPFANHRANMAAPISHARFYIGVLIKTLST